MHTIKGTSGDKFEFKAPRAGMYKFCFHNPQKTPETVSFYIHSGHIPNEHNLAKDGKCNEPFAWCPCACISFLNSFVNLEGNPMDNVDPNFVLILMAAIVLFLYIFL